ncbi:MAG: VCBS repeat-containing protein, partial [Chitinophagaceae bacterium]
DWSWSALWGDYDNDGDKDLMVTNGFYRDLGNLDYINYQARLQNPMGRQTAKKEEKLKAIQNLKKIPLHDYLFENNGDLTFHKRSEDWGFTEPGFSNGACYADLDNDGDLELIINQFNAEAKIFKNIADQLNKNHYLKISLQGPEKNKQGIGSKVYVYTGAKMQLVEMNPYRGFESTVDPIIHFGMGSFTKVDSIKIEWPDGKYQYLNQCKTDTLLKIKYSPTSEEFYVEKNTNDYFKNDAHQFGIDYLHKENEFVDFKIQPLLPKMYSQGGPGIAVGDVNGDSLDDFYIGGAAGSDGALFIQRKDGHFSRQSLSKPHFAEDMGVLFLDADKDDDLDLYVVSGGSENNEVSNEQQDRIYINDGKGNFHQGILPNTSASGSCVIGADYDRDGDVDLFIGGRVTPGSYPLPCRSYLLRNDTRVKDKPIFTDITPQELQRPGMVCSATWTDLDKDNWPDLMITGEFMPIRLFRNIQGRFSEITKSAKLDQTSGWWNCITTLDIDHDGDMDFIAGNLGLNSRHKASLKEPLCIYAKDFDKNGRIDPIMCYYVQGENYIYPTRDEMIKQINSIRLRFPTYESYAHSSFSESFTQKELQDAYVVKAFSFESSVFINQGNGTFDRKPLPLAAQISPIFGIIARDLNADGMEDIILSGNDYATEASTGRYDAMRGLVLMNDRKSNFKESKQKYPELDIDKDCKGMAIFYSAKQKPYLLVSNNNDSLQVLSLPPVSENIIHLSSSDVLVKIRERSGKSYQIEFYNNGNYLSSGSRKLEIRNGIDSISIIDSKGRSHEVIQKSSN